MNTTILSSLFLLNSHVGFSEQKQLLCEEMELIFIVLIKKKQLLESMNPRMGNLTRAGWAEAPTWLETFFFFFF